MRLQAEYNTYVARLDSLQREFERQRLLLSPEKTREKEVELQTLYQTTQQFQQVKFGPEGELYRKQSQMEYELLSKVKVAVDNVAISKGYDFIFDGSVSLLYGKPTHDLTDDVLFELRKAKGN
jgi:Skp family chaperone for outer membrane proteins